MNDDANIIQQHPEFPFGETLARDRLERWEESFDRRPEPDEPASALLQEFLEFVERYAFLERIVQGEIRYELPVHPRFLEQRERSDDPLEQQAAELAEAEAELIGSPDVPSMGLLDEAEDIGVKLLTTSDTAKEELVGSFFFEGEAGPAFLVGTERDDPRAAFVLAHLLCHYVADHDPYQNRVCRWHPETLENLDESPIEVRADLFARALLVPEEPLRRYLEQLGTAVSGGETEAERSWEILSTLFGVPETLLADRMEDLGFGALAAQMRMAGGETSPGGEPEAAQPERLDRRRAALARLANDAGPEAGVGLPTEGSLRLPSRYLNLALACYHERIMERDVLAQFLGMSEMETEAVLQWSQVGRCAPDAASDPDDDDADGGPDMTIH
ncbi:MAG: ImmA/IrrE family metallo-endopeptidase [Candidatus Eisenbacteria bacterium]